MRFVPTILVCALISSACASPARQSVSAAPSDKCAAIADSTVAQAGLRIDHMPRPTGGLWTVPDSLRSGLPFRGEFVIDTSGRVEAGSIRVLESSNDDLSSFARARIAEMTWSPAEHHGCRIQYRVPFTIQR
jgi:hypothetical protein